MADILIWQLRKAESFQIGAHNKIIAIQKTHTEIYLAFLNKFQVFCFFNHSLPWLI